MTIDQVEQGSGMGGGVVPGVFDAADARRPTLVGERWAVVAGHPLVAELAAELLRDGGTAVDAGVRAGFASNVVQVDMCNLGGIAPILLRTQRDGVRSIAGVGRWSRRASVEALRARYGDALPLGGAPSIVPGALAGWLTALADFGTRTLAEVLEPVREVAWNGFVLDDRTAASLRVMSRGFARWSSSAEVFLRDGQPMRPGERLVQRDLARLLDGLVAAEAAATSAGAGRRDAIRAAMRWFYEGEPARQICSFVTDNGGFLDLEDLAEFRAEVEVAPSVRFGDWDVHVTPQWSQGPIVAMTLAVLAERGISTIAFDSPRYWHEVVESLKVAFSERERVLGHPDPPRVLGTEMFDADRIREVAATIAATAAENLPTVGAAGATLSSTTAVVVHDSEGNAFAVSPSDTLDGAPLVPGLGILCSPRGVQSRLSLDHPNRVRPWARPCVTPAAVVAVESPGMGSRGSASDDPLRVWSLACPGGDVIVQAIVQAMLASDLTNQSPQAAVERPRVFGSSYPCGFAPHPSLDKAVFVEADLPAGVWDDLGERGHQLLRWPANEFDAGSVQMIRDQITPDGTRVLMTGADSRRSAYALVR